MVFVEPSKNFINKVQKQVKKDCLKSDSKTIHRLTSTILMYSPNFFLKKDYRQQIASTLFLPATVD